MLEFIYNVAVVSVCVANRICFPKLVPLIAEGPLDGCLQPVSSHVIA